MDSQEIKKIARAAENGDSEAMYRLACLYEKGDDIKQDEQEAFKWFKKAAEEGDSGAMCKVGLAYLTGNGVDEDEQEGLKWMEKAADEGDAYAMYFIGKCFHKGMHGYSVNYRRAKNWYEKAIEAYPGIKNIKGFKEDLNQLSIDMETKSDDDCFITTAVCDSFGKADDCYELTAFRKFRDNWLAIQSDGKSLIDEYYNVAPKIVAKINSLGDSAEVYKNIWRDYLSACLKSIEVGDNSKCKKIYVDMVNSLKEKFLK